MARSSFTYTRDRVYITRVLAGAALALLLCVIAVRWWPISRTSPASLHKVRSHEVVDMAVVEQTVQASQHPPPPPPVVRAPPVEVPDAIVLPEESLDVVLPEGISDARPAVRSGQVRSDTVQSVSGIPPKPIRLVEPDYTAAARKRGVRARIVVKLLVDETGQVQDQRIVRRLLLDEGARILQPVEEIGFGLEEAALSAAEQWRFRPGRRNGTSVSAYTEITFTFGL